MTGNAELVATISIASDATVRDTLETIDRGGLGTALLVGRDDGRFAGIVTDGDIRRALLAGMTLDARVAEVPRPKPSVGRVGMTTEQVAAVFSEHVRVVPLLDDDDRVADLAVFDSRARLPVAEPFLGELELRYVSECVLSGWVSSAGPFVRRFEDVFAAFCGSRHAVATSNGTTALHLVLAAIGVGPGDEVVVPTLTFVATANAVTYTGARPVLVDSERSTWNIDPEQVAAAITPRTKAIVPVHLYGHPAEMDALRGTARAHGLTVVEDAAEAHGARYRGQPVGSIGDAGIFSFYGNKIVTTGEGGMVVTDDDALAERLRMLRDHGAAPGRRYHHPVVGFNYRLTNLQAALGVAQMERLDEILAAKRRIADRYRTALEGVPGITLPPQQPWAHNVHWLYSILVSEDVFGLSRDELTDRLDAAGVETRPVFPPLHTQPPYAAGGGSYPVAEELAGRGLSLPSAVGLRDDEIDRVAGLIARAGR
jgi:perosamine synthetase